MTYSELTEQCGLIKAYNCEKEKPQDNPACQATMTICNCLANRTNGGGSRHEKSRKRTNLVCGHLSLKYGHFYLKQRMVTL